MDMMSIVCQFENLKVKSLVEQLKIWLIKDVLVTYPGVNTEMKSTHQL